MSIRKSKKRMEADSNSQGLSILAIAIAGLALIAAGVSAYYSYRSNADNRLVLQLDRHPRISLAARPNQVLKHVAVENHGDASALDLQVYVSISVYDPERDGIISQSEISRAEWFTPELPVDGEPFVVNLLDVQGSLPYMFEPEALIPGRHVFEARVTCKRGVDSLRYEERALYIFGDNKRWIAAKEVNTDEHMLLEYGAAIRCALAQPVDRSFVPNTDAVESRSGYGADLVKQ